MHFDTKRLPVLDGEGQTQRREYLFVAIDDFSRELYAAILPDRTQHSSAAFLTQVVDECPYEIDYTYSDNGKEYKGAENHEFVKACKVFGIWHLAFGIWHLAFGIWHLAFGIWHLALCIGQKFTRINRPQTNGKAEHVIRTMMEMWHNKERFSSRKQRHTSFIRFINYYNTVKPHKGIDNFTPYVKLIEYFYPEKL